MRIRWNSSRITGWRSFRNIADASGWLRVEPANFEGDYRSLLLQCLCRLNYWLRKRLHSQLFIFSDI